MIHIEGWYRRLSGLEGKSYFFRMATVDVGGAVLHVGGSGPGGCWVEAMVLVEASAAVAGGGKLF